MCICKCIFVSLFKSKFVNISFYLSYSFCDIETYEFTIFYMQIFMFKNLYIYFSKYFTYFVYS